MQFAKSLVGAIIGAAVGIALLFAIYRFSDGFWSAIPFAILTGLGVRMAVTTGGHPSYARGALTAIIALAAYIGGLSLVAYTATARANAPVAHVAAADQSSEGKGDGENKDADAAASQIAETKTNTMPTEGHRGPIVGPQQFNTWNFVWLGIAAFVAYELGRGSDAATAYSEPAATPIAAGAHPDA
ncbi:MAG TPA: hypothetical protein VH107_10730 [Lacipirellulaceae bacterium]|jgi:uncharacterized membrane protein|nr:hypothetical protein [Lacipirellulaceae bacterium]